MRHRQEIPARDLKVDDFGSPIERGPTVFLADDGEIEVQAVVEGRRFLALVAPDGETRLRVPGRRGHRREFSLPLVDVAPVLEVLIAAYVSKVSELEGRALAERVARLFP